MGGRRISMFSLPIIHFTHNVAFSCLARLRPPLDFDAVSLIREREGICKRDQDSYNAWLCELAELQSVVISEAAGFFVLLLCSRGAFSASQHHEEQSPFAKE